MWQLAKTVVISLVLKEVGPEMLLFHWFQKGRDNRQSPAPVFRPTQNVVISLVLEGVGPEMLLFHWF